MDSDKQDEELSRGTFNCFCAYERPVIKSLNNAKSPFTVAFEALSKYPIHQACTNQECIYYSPYDFSRVPPEFFSTCVCMYSRKSKSGNVEAGEWKDWNRLNKPQNAFLPPSQLHFSLLLKLFFFPWNFGNELACALEEWVVFKSLSKVVVHRSAANMFEPRPIEIAWKGAESNIGFSYLPRSILFWGRIVGAPSSGPRGRYPIIYLISLLNIVPENYDPQLFLSIYIGSCVPGWWRHWAGGK